MEDIKELTRAKLLRFIAYQMTGVNRSTCREVMTRYKYSNSPLQGKLLEEMLERNEIYHIRSGYYGALYGVAIDEIFDFMWDINKKDYLFFSSLSTSSNGRYYNSWDIPKVEFRDMLMKWKLGNEILNYDWSEVNSLHVLYYLIRELPSHPNWSKILSSLDFSGAYTLMLLNLQYVFSTLDINLIDMYSQKISMLCENCDKADLKMYNSTLYLFSHILPGKINEFENLEDSNSFGYFATQAIGLHYTKNYSKALTAYRKSAKMEGENNVISTNPLYSLLFIKALSQEAKAGWHERLVKLNKHLQTSNKEHYLAASIYSNFLQERECAPYVHYIIESWNEISPINLALSVIIILHYKISVLPQFLVSLAEDTIDNDRFLLLQLEASSSLPRYIAKREELIGRLNIEPIFESYRVLEPWEKKLDELNDLLIENNVVDTSGDETKPKEKSRIIYLVDENGNFQPRMQKTKNGVTWSKGQNIPLNKFNSTNIDSFTMTDKVVSSLVKSYNQGRVYSLRGANVFAVLINHPLVFTANNQDVAVSIISDTPYIRVESNSKEIKVTTNVKDLKDSRNVVNKDSDVLYRIFSLSSLQSKILKLFKNQSTFPISAKEKITKMLVDISPVITVYSDITSENENIKSIDGLSRITVQLLPINEGLKVELFVKPIEDFDQYCKVGDGNDKFFAEYNGERVAVKRDTKNEKKNFAKLQKIINEEVGYTDREDSFYIENIYDSLSFIERLQENKDILRVEWPKGAKIKIIGAVDFKKLNISLRSKAGWFELDGDVKVDKDLQLTLAELLEKNKSGKGRFVELSNGEFLAITKDLKRKLNELEANLSHGKKGEMKLSQFSSGIVNDLENGGVKVSKDAKFKALEKRIREAGNVEITVPQTLQAELRDYQVDGYMWLARLSAWGAGACLADDMGLGKTVQSIALLLHRAQKGASLIVAPASVVHNWQSELRRFSPSLRCLILHDNITERESIITSSTSFDIVITTYGLLSRIGDIITAKEWNVILLDEAHNIKNRDTKSSKIAMNLKGDFRLMLTGTPIQNHLGEIWNLFNFTNPGLLGSFESFVSKFINPIEQGNDKSIQRELKRILQPFMLRRTKSEVLDELPTKTEIVHRVEFSKQERALYENFRLQALSGLKSGGLNPIQSLAEITRLRQLACHPSLIDNTLDIASSKVARFIELTSELVENKHRALVFSQFTSFLGYVKKALEGKGIPYLYLDGSTPIKEREKLVQSFQQGDCPIFLISLKAGGTGLNLTAADYVIHLDPWWNPAIEDQASDRSHRIGQTRPVTIYRLISKDTIEEKILELHKSKKSLSDSLLEGSNLSHKLSREDMLDLLSGKF